MRTALFLPLLLCSCSFVATIVGGSKQTVEIRASEPGAELYVDGARLGPGSHTVRLSRGSSHRIDAVAPDGRNGNAWLHSTASTTGVLDTIFGSILLVPLLGLLFPGAWTLDFDGPVEVQIPPAAGVVPEPFRPPPLKR